ncbi:transcription factor TFIIF complex subunit Tfg3 [Recurvomyces mirabilis]|nr:transcription factor TFIIF complex subunit Tfg3 [Recurvomyces mirabilis]
MPDVKRTIKIRTHQEILPDVPQEAEGYPMRGWTISIFLVGPDGEDMPANCFERATYHLHESFGKRQRQVLKNPPFTIKERGWGEFDMSIVLSPVGLPKNGDQSVQHDLNFQQEEYESTHSVTFRNPKENLLAILKESAPAGENTNGTTAASKPEKKARQKTSRNVDMEKLADALPQLQEDDLLQIVQMIHDNKTDDTYTKNDVENGEFHVDLYTLPDPLIKMLWDFCDKKVDMNALA